MEISDNKIRFGNEVLNTNTMMVTTTYDPNMELIPSITLDWNNEKYNNLTITIKNENGDVLKEQTDTGQFTYRDKKITLCIQIQVDLDGDTSLYYSLSFLELSQSLESYQHEGLTFDVICYMPVILQLYYNLLPHIYVYLNTIILDIESEFFEGINDIPEPLLTELRDEYNRITFLFSSSQPNFGDLDLDEIQKVYEVKSTKKNRCNFYDNFLALANLRLDSLQKESLKKQNSSIFLKQKRESQLTKFYILFKKENVATI